MARVIKDADRFIMKSKSGSQWFVCVLTNPKSKPSAVTGQYSYEITKVCYSESCAKKTLEKTMTFTGSVLTLAKQKQVKKRKKLIQEIINA